MLRSLNPFGWLHSTQNWFARAERSSGFRPYLVFFLLCIGLSLTLLLLFPTQVLVQIFALGLIGMPAVCFIGLFAWKAERDPDFCRSESHVQKVLKVQLEMMGNETKQIEGEVLDRVGKPLPVPKTGALPNSVDGGGEQWISLLWFSIDNRTLVISNFTNDSSLTPGFTNGGTTSRVVTSSGQKWTKANSRITLPVQLRKAGYQ